MTPPNPDNLTTLTHVLRRARRRRSQRHAQYPYWRHTYARPLQHLDNELELYERFKRDPKP